MNIKNTSINTLDKQHLALLMKEISNDVASAIAKTYGPYGANTLIQSADSVYATKDGWTVAQHLNYPNNGVKNALKKLILDCMQAVLLKVGDGTSTVSLLANAIYNRVYDKYIVEGKPFNVKELESTLNSIVQSVGSTIADAGKLISGGDGQQQRDIIYKVASISTNWDDEMAGFIADIYAKTGNPIIKFENSGSDESRVEYVDGYEIKGIMSLKNFYINDHKNGKCVVDNPAVLVFNYSVGVDMFEVLYLVSESLKTDGISLIVIAPDFTPDFTKTLKTIQMHSQRTGGAPITLIPFKYYNNLNIDKDCVDDLCYLLNTETVAQDNTDMSDMFKDLKEALQAKVYIDKMDNPDPEEKEAVYENASSMISAAKEYLKAACGTCNQAILTDKYFMAEGFPNANETVLKQRADDLEHEIDVKTKECAALSMITEGIRMKRVRLGKLKLKMGVIYVGGFGDAHLKERRDALDDATKACEAVYESGYTVGGGLAPLIAIDKLMTAEDAPSDDLWNSLIDIMFHSYKEVMRVMYRNKYADDEKQIEKLICQAIHEETPFNLITEASDTNLISPVSGEIEILKGCMSLVMVMIGTNQFVFNDIRSIEDVERLSLIEKSGNIGLEGSIKLLNC